MKLSTNSILNKMTLYEYITISNSAYTIIIY